MVIPSGPARALCPQRRRLAEDALEAVPGGAPGCSRGRALPPCGRSRRTGAPRFSTRPCPQSCSRLRVSRGPLASLVAAVAISQGARVSAPRQKLPPAAGAVLTAAAPGDREAWGGGGARPAPLLCGLLRGPSPTWESSVCVCVSLSHPHRYMAVALPPSSRTSSRPHRAQGAVLRRFSPALGSPAQPDAAAPAAPCLLAKGACPAAVPTAIYGPEITKSPVSAPGASVFPSPGPACLRRTSRLQGLVGAEATPGQRSARGRRRGLWWTPARCPDPLSGSPGPQPTLWA